MEINRCCIEIKHFYTWIENECFFLVQDMIKCNLASPIISFSVVWEVICWVDAMPIIINLKFWKHFFSVLRYTDWMMMESGMTKEQAMSLLTIWRFVDFFGSDWCFWNIEGTLLHCGFFLYKICNHYRFFHLATSFV